MASRLKRLEKGEWEEKIWKADREFQEWRKKQAPALAALNSCIQLREG